MTRSYDFYHPLLAPCRECEYLVSETTARMIRQHLQAHAQLDPACERTQDGCYPMYSIHFDSPEFRHFEDVVTGVRNHLELRLRYYSENDDSQVFFEVLRRSGLQVLKSRHAVPRLLADRFLESGVLDLSLDRNGCLREFVKHCAEFDGKPVLRIRNMREAWETNGDNPVRISLDTHVQYCIPSNLGLREARPDWNPTSITMTILRIRSTDRQPPWVAAMIQQLRLQPQSISKYAESVNSIMRQSRRAVELVSHVRLNSAWNTARTETG